jgi:hypothetical protein
MGAPLTYNWTEKIFDTRRKTNDFKAYKTDTRLTKSDDGTFMFTYLQYNWEEDKTTHKFKRSDVRAETPLVSITPDNVVTLLAPDMKGWPSVHHMTIRNRLQDITGLAIYSDTGHHRNKETPIRITSRYYGQHGWQKQAWCANTNDKSIPYKMGTQFRTIDNKSGMTECLNIPKDIKRVVKNEAVQAAKADTVIIRKLAMVMLRVGFEEHIEKKLNSYWYAPQQIKLIKDIDYKNPTGDDALAVLAQGLRMATRPDAHVWKEGKYTELSMEERISLLRSRTLENGMKALRQHIYATTNGYDKVEVS